MMPAMPTGAGLGLRRDFIRDLQSHFPAAIRFLEIAPENWMDMGGQSLEQLQWLASQRPLLCHGLSLSLGGTAPLDRAFLRRVGRFLDRYRVALYSEHLSYCSDSGHLYDLLPIPFTEEAVHHVAARIRQTQDILQRRIAVENASFYVWSPLNTLDEATFVKAVIAEADCDLHLDVNNVYVNSVNHGFDAAAYIDSLPSGRIVYLHVAGHYEERADLLIDTHGSSVPAPVWTLLEHAYRTHGPRPTLLERDFNIPPLTELVEEVTRIAELQEACR